MLTSRGWWFLVLMLLQSFLGIMLAARNQVGPVIAIMGFSLLTWFLIEWLVFTVRVRFAIPRLKLDRSLRMGRRKIPVIWAGQEFEVNVQLSLDSRFSLPYLIFQDRPPTGCERIEGIDYRVTVLNSDKSVGVKYKLRCDTPGEIRFEGIRIQIADLQGFFYHRTFVHKPSSYAVLPPLANAEGRRRSSKSQNILPPPGVHRLRSPGGGSELHELRDYRSGDPPKMIAWKTSARRDKLIVKEYETDVPIRCTLFVDASQSVRIGVSRETMLNQLTVLASAVAQAAFSDRDLVGLTIFDEHEVDIVLPNRSSRHLIDLLHHLARASRAPILSNAPDIDSLCQLATPLAYELYPDLMTSHSNSSPWKAFWEPLLDYRKSTWVVICCVPLLLILSYAAAFGFAVALEFDNEAKTLWENCEAAQEALGSAFLPILIGVLAAGLFAGLWWLGHGLSGMFAPWLTLRVRRKKLASLLAALDQAAPGTDARLLDDDRFMADRLQRFLSEHHRRYPVALYDEDGRYLFGSSEKIDVLARTLLRSIAHGRDNELFVLMADLIELDGELDPLFKAIRIAVARHHQVLVICPWMPGIPVLDDELSPRERTRAIKLEAKRQRFRGIDAKLFVQSVLRYYAAYDRLRRAFAKIGVMVIRAQQQDSVRLILNRMDRLRGVRARR